MELKIFTRLLILSTLCHFVCSSQLKPLIFAEMSDLKNSLIKNPSQTLFSSTLNVSVLYDMI